MSINTGVDNGSLTDGTNSLPGLVLRSSINDIQENASEIFIKFPCFHYRNCIQNSRLQDGGDFVQP